MAVSGDATSVQVDLLNVLIGDDDLVRAVAVDNADFLNASKYPISDTPLTYQSQGQDGGARRGIVVGGTIRRHALKFERIMPYMYDEKTFTAQGVYVMYGVNEVLGVSDYSRPVIKSDLLKALYLDVYVIVHHNLIESRNDGFFGTRIDFIMDRIIELVDGRRLGKGGNKSFTEFTRKTNEYFAARNGRWHGRKAQFKAASLNAGCIV